MWEQVKQTLVESTRKVCGSVKEGEKNSKSVWWKDKVNAEVKRKEAAWKEML